MNAIPAEARARAVEAVPSPLRRPERDGDAALLLALFRDAHGASLAGLDPALRDALLGQQFAGQSAGRRAAHPGGRFEIVEVDGRPAGRLVTDVSEGAVRLVEVALLPDRRGRGVGTALLRALQAEARGAGLPLRLSVLRSNAGARRFYARLGFAVAAEGALHLDLCWTAWGYRAGAHPRSTRPRPRGHDATRDGRC